MDFEKHCGACHEADVTFRDDWGKGEPWPPEAAAAGATRLLEVLPGLGPSHRTPPSALAQALLPADVLPPADSDVFGGLINAEALPERLTAAARHCYEDVLAADARPRIAARVERAAHRPMPEAVQALLGPRVGLREAAQAALRGDPHPPTAGAFGLRAGDRALVYWPTGHKDPTLAALVRLATVFAVKQHTTALVRAMTTAPRSPLRSCTKCHRIDTATLDITWAPNRRRRSDFAAFVHGAHHLGPGPVTDATCTTCHTWPGIEWPGIERVALLGRRRWIKALSAHAPNPLSSFAGRHDPKTCATCHQAEAVPSTCQTCHDYHQGRVIRRR